MIFHPDAGDTSKGRVLSEADRNMLERGVPMMCRAAQDPISQPAYVLWQNGRTNPTQGALDVNRGRGHFCQNEPNPNRARPFHGLE